MTLQDIIYIFYFDEVWDEWVENNYPLDEIIFDDDALRDAHHGDADDQTDGEYPPENGNDHRELGEQHPGHLIKGDNPRKAAADQGGKAVAPQDEAQDKRRCAQRSDDEPRQKMKVFHFGFS